MAHGLLILEILLPAKGGEKRLSSGILSGKQSVGIQFLASETVSGMTSKTIGVAISEFLDTSVDMIAPGSLA